MPLLLEVQTRRNPPRVLGITENDGWDKLVFEECNFKSKEPRTRSDDDVGEPTLLTYHQPNASNKFSTKSLTSDSSIQSRLY